MILKSSIDKVLDAAQVEEVISDFVNLKKRGANFLGLCPFHDEKTPSFTVSPVKGIYKCFGCSKAGSSVTFLMEHEHMSYPESIEYLAKKYNIELEYTQKTEEVKEEELRRESIFILNNFAKNHFVEQLNSEIGRSIALTYFHERGINDEMIKKFDLGFAPDDRDMLLKTALKLGYKEDMLHNAGLINKDKKIDFFRNRVMFPIHNLSGKVIAFGGRILNKNIKAPKYINTPESEVYVKSRILYGIYQAKAAIRKIRSVLTGRGLYGCDRHESSWN